MAKKKVFKIVFTPVDVYYQTAPNMGKAIEWASNNYRRDQRLEIGHPVDPKEAHFLFDVAEEEDAD